MNKRQAEQISLVDILEKEGFRVVNRTRGGTELWYSPNPLREESEPSFTINPHKNVWHDFGTGKGGGVVQFVEQYQQLEFKEALGWLRNRYSGIQAAAYQVRRSDSADPSPSAARYSIQKVQTLQNSALINYMQGRKISPETAREHLQEAYYSDSQTGKTFFGVCLTNHSGGFEIRNKYLKTCIGSKDFSYIPGQKDSTEIHVFEGFTDFLTYLEMNNQKQPEPHCIILNGLKLAEKAAGFIADLHQDRPREVILWLDNERDGSEARTAVSTAAQHFARHQYPTGSVSHQYPLYKDLNDYWAAGNPPIQPVPKPIAVNDNQPGPKERAEIERRQEPENPRQFKMF